MIFHSYVSLPEGTPKASDLRSISSLLRILDFFYFGFLNADYLVMNHTMSIAVLGSNSFGG